MLFCGSSLKGPKSCWDGSWEEPGRTQSQRPEGNSPPGERSKSSTPWKEVWESRCSEMLRGAGIEVAEILALTALSFVFALWFCEFQRCREKSHPNKICLTPIMDWRMEKIPWERQRVRGMEGDPGGQQASWQPSLRGLLQGSALVWRARDTMGETSYFYNFLLSPKEQIKILYKKSYFKVSVPLFEQMTTRWC